MNFRDLIIETAKEAAFSKEEINNINATVENLKQIILGDTDFDKLFLGGSFARKTMVKGISDVDIYIKYNGTGNANSALAKLRNRLSDKYNMTKVSEDYPSVAIQFRKIPINVTPYKENKKGKMCIADKPMQFGKEIDTTELNKKVLKLSEENSDYLSVIKVLKIWNKNSLIGFKNFKIEDGFCNLILSQKTALTPQESLLLYLKLKSHLKDGKKFDQLLKMTQEAQLRAAWKDFMKKK